MGVHCRRADPVRLREGFRCRYGTKMSSIHRSTSDQLDKNKPLKGVSNCLSILLYHSKTEYI